MTELEEKILEVERLADKDSFIGNDLERIKNIYNKYINRNQAERFCMHCPGSIKQLVQRFRSTKEIIIKRIVSEYESLNKNKNSTDG